MFEHLSSGEKFPDKFNVLIEIPKGSHNKYEYDEKLGVIKLDRVLFSPFYYPTDYGFIPETKAEDGDHLDALVLSTDPLFPGCLVEVRPIALLKMEDDKGLDNKILAVVDSDPRLSHIKSLSDISAHTPKEIVHFFETYKNLEGKKVTVSGFGNLKEAILELKRTKEAFDFQHK